MICTTSGIKLGSYPLRFSACIVFEIVCVEYLCNVGCWTVCSSYCGTCTGSISIALVGLFSLELLPVSIPVGGEGGYVHSVEVSMLF